MIDVYGILSNYIHANLSFHTEIVKATKEELTFDVNSRLLIVMAELLILLHQINGEEVSQGIIDIGLNEELAKKEFEQIFLKKFSTGQKVLYKLENAIGEIIEKTDSTDKSYNYLVRINGEFRKIPSSRIEAI